MRRQIQTKRIVSLAPSITETLFALGAGKRLSGITMCCDYPDGTAGVEKIGGFAAPDIDKIKSVRPDLVLAAGFHSKTGIVSQLRREGMRVGIINAETVLDVSSAVLRAGNLAGCRKKARQLADRIRRSIREIRKQLRRLAHSEKPRTCYICGCNPFRAARDGCCGSALIELAGGRNVGTGVPHNKPLCLKTVAERNPDVIVVGTGHGVDVDLLDYVRSEKALRATRAVQDGRIYRIDDALVTRPGPRAVEGLRRFAEFLHPEIFCRKR